MPYLMGGFPDLDTSRAIGEAYVDAGADLIELGVPFSDPLADGPVIHAAATAALRAGATVDGVLEVGRALARRVPVVADGLRQPRAGAAAPSAFATRLRRRRHRRADRARPARSRRPPACSPRATRPGVALVPLVAPTTTDERLRRDRRAGARLPLHGLAHRHDRRAQASCRPACPRCSRGPRPRPRCRSRSASASRRPSRPARRRRSGADGVIVGTRLVREAAEAADPPAAVGALVGGLAAGLGD